MAQLQLEDLRRAPNALAAHYSRFRVEERLLLTGHSHQGWPDRALDGQVRAFADAAQHVDEKWERAFATADRLRQALRTFLEDRDGSYALAESTHHLLVSFLSALPLRRRPKLVTTDGEFHTIRRQLARLSEVDLPSGESWLEIVRLPAEPYDTLAARMAATVDDRTAAVLTSAVFFASSRIARGLGNLAAACHRHGAELMVDAYHSTGVVPLGLADHGLEDAYLVGGGYKYLQIGEGNCWMRVPPHRKPRPLITGWYAEFSALSNGARPDRAPYAPGADAFAGATYDPTSHYRAAAVLDFWQEQGLTSAFLRQISQHQLGLLRHLFDQLDLPPALIDRDRVTPLSEFGGFLALTTPRAGEIHRALRQREVFTDYRGHILRLGPAPYLSDRQLEAAMGHLGEAVRRLFDAS